MTQQTDIESFRIQLLNYENNIYNPIDLLFQGDNFSKWLDSFEEINLKLDNLYDLLEKIKGAISENDYLKFFCKYQIEQPFKNEFQEYMSFEYTSSLLFDFEMFVKSEIEIMENKTGKRYWKENKINIAKRKTDITKSISHTKEEIKQKQILQLFLKASENVLFEKNDTAIGFAVHFLTGKKFEAEQTRKDIAERKGYDFDVLIYDTTIQKVEKILLALKKEKNKLSPDN
ncbi:hypothetical protein ACFOW1_03620 [Parasediminibacterium paludis]|uniref:Uncharacterized protein n=1 Tax=Parasediminibacterium paludis TaxID=908966 RepID=A0ABV8PS57_9BACT